MKRFIPLVGLAIVVGGLLTSVLAVGPEPPEQNWTWGHYVYYGNGLWEFHCDGSGDKRCALDIEIPETGICSIPVDSLPGFIEEDAQNYYFYAVVESDSSIVNDDEGSIVMIVPKATYTSEFCPGE